MYQTLEQAIELIQPASSLFIQTGAAAPQQLVRKLMERAPILKDMTIYQMHTEGPAPYGDAQWNDIFQVNCFFIGANLRKAVQEKRADYIPIFLSEVPGLFRNKKILIDYALIHVSPPDENGFCSLGVSVDISPAVLESAKCIIAQVNPNMPRTHGDSFIHTSRLNAMVMVDDEILTVIIDPPDETSLKIGGFVASLVEDGATLQMGIGNLPNAVLRSLSAHRRLGVHTEMFSDGMIDLIRSGVITGEMKKNRKNKAVSSFMIGSKKLYRFAHNNPGIEMLDIAYVNDVNIIRENPRMTAINSALEIDITGQVCADSIGNKMYSGVGGQIDFMRGASMSPGGKPIIAMCSVTSRGESKIVPCLKSGAGVVSTRANVHYVVTEFGIAYLYGKNLRARAKALVDIAHPDHREHLASGV